MPIGVGDSRRRRSSGIARPSTPLLMRWGDGRWERGNTIGCTRGKHTIGARHTVFARDAEEDAEPHKTLCAECAAKHAARIRRYWAALDEEKRQETLRRKHEVRTLNKTRGLCIYCGKKAVKGRTHCLECALRRKRKGEARLEARRVKTDFSEGLCCRCNEPVMPGKKLCKKHYDAAIKGVKAMQGMSPSEKHGWRSDNRLIFKQKK